MSDNLVLDFSNVQKSEPVPDGTYHVVVEKAEYKPSKQSNTLTSYLQLNIEEGDQEGRKLWANYPLDPSSGAAWKTVEVLTAMGFQIEGNPEFKMPKAEELIGIHLVVKTKIKTSEGYDPQAEIKKFMPYEEMPEL